MPNTRISALTAAVSVAGTDVYPSVQTAGVGPVKTSLDQIKNYTLGGSGTLPVANGGTGLTSLTTGRIPFGAGTSAYGNSASLFWDTANARLGVGTSSPIATLHVAAGSGATLAQIVVGYLGSANYYDADTHYYRNAAGSNVMSVDSVGRVSPSAATIYTGSAGSYSGVITNFGGGNNYYDAGVHIFRNASQAEGMRLSAGNLGLGTTTFGTSAAKVLAIGNGTAPTTSPAGVGQLYVEAGALKYRGSSGTVTTIAAA